MTEFSNTIVPDSNIISVNTARQVLTETLDNCGMWNDDCEKAAATYARAMDDAGFDHKTMLKGLHKAGITKDGARELIYNIQACKDVSSEVKPETRSGFWLIGSILLAVSIVIGVVIALANDVSLGTLHWVIIGVVFGGQIANISSYINLDKNIEKAIKEEESVKQSPEMSGQETGSNKQWWAMGILVVVVILLFVFIFNIVKHM